MPRASLSSEQIDEFRERLVSAAMRLFARRGYEGVTLRAIAAELGCSPMTSYRYFRDKAAIFAAVRTAAYRSFADAQEAARDAASEPAAVLVALGRAYTRFAIENPDAYRLMFELSQQDEEAHPELAKCLAHHRSLMTAWAQDAIDAGLVEGDAQTLGQLFWAGMHGVIMLEIAGKLSLGRSFDRLSKEMVRTLFRGMEPER